MLATLQLIGRKHALGYVALGVTLAASEAFGLSMLLPILALVEQGTSTLDPSDLPSVWRGMMERISAAGLSLNIVTLLLLAAIPLFVRIGSFSGRLVYITWLTSRAVKTLRTEATEAFLVADLEFTERHDEGELMSRILNDANRAGTRVSSILQLLGDTLVIAFSVTAMMLISASLTLVALGIVLLGALAMGRFVSISRQHGEDISVASSLMVSTLENQFQGLRLIKLQGQEEAEIQKSDEIFDRLRALQVRNRSVQALVGAAPEPLFLVGFGLILYLSIVVLGLSLAGLGILGVLLLRLMPTARSVNVIRQQLATDKPAFDNVRRVTAEARSSREIVTGTRQLDHAKPAIAFDHVSFAYASHGHRIEALRDISLVIPHGAMTAIVGRSGAGKSTLSSLIPRLRNVDDGQVLIDDVPIQEYDLGSLRRAIGVVAQDTFLFNGTIRENIAYGLPQASEQAIRDAATQAHAHEFIANIPDGYDALVGDRGTRLSTGQRQRIGIARVMLKQPSIIIMDEPTSALDSETEQYIEKNMEELRDKTTLIVIAHRLSTIRKADQIVVLDEGSIVEQGSHESLMAHGGTYKRLFSLQMFT